MAQYITTLDPCDISKLGETGSGITVSHGGRRYTVNLGYAEGAASGAVMMDAGDVPYVTACALATHLGKRLEKSVELKETHGQE